MKVVAELLGILPLHWGTFSAAMGTNFWQDWCYSLLSELLTCQSNWEFWVQALAGIFFSTGKLVLTQVPFYVDSFLRWINRHEYNQGLLGAVLDFVRFNLSLDAWV
jgi:hypothetical protein